MKKLVVTAPFGAYEVGAEVYDAKEIAKIEEENPDKAVAVKAPKPPEEPADTKAKS